MRFTFKGAFHVSHGFSRNDNHRSNRISNADTKNKNNIHPKEEDRERERERNHTENATVQVVLEFAISAYQDEFLEKYPFVEPVSGSLAALVFVFAIGGIQANV